MPIKTFSQFVGIGQSALRYYDEIGLLSPAIRGKNGYRYYTPHQVMSANFIQVMRDLKIPLKTIQELMKNRQLQQLAGTLVLQRDHLINELRCIAELKSLLLVYQVLIGEANEELESAIYVRYFEATPLTMGSEIGAKESPSSREGFWRFFTELVSRKTNLRYPIGEFFDDADMFFEKPNSPTCFYSLDPSGGDGRDAGKYLVGYTRCPYHTMNDLPERLCSYAAEHGLEFCGPVYKLFILNEASSPEGGDYLIQVAASVS